MEGNSHQSNDRFPVMDFVLESNARMPRVKYTENIERCTTAGTRCRLQNGFFFFGIAGDGRSPRISDVFSNSSTLGDESAPWAVSEEARLEELLSSAIFFLPGW